MSRLSRTPLSQALALRLPAALFEGTDPGVSVLHPAALGAGMRSEDLKCRQELLGACGGHAARAVSKVFCLVGGLLGRAAWVIGFLQVSRHMLRSSRTGGPCVVSVRSAQCTGACGARESAFSRAKEGQGGLCCASEPFTAEPRSWGRRGGGAWWGGSWKPAGHLRCEGTASPPAWSPGLLLSPRSCTWGLHGEAVPGSPGGMGRGPAPCGEPF